MKILERKATILIATIAGLAFSQVAAAQDLNAKQDHPESRIQGSVDGMKAVEAGEKGDWATEAMLATRAYRANPSVTNEFNLATSLQHMNRSTLAIPLYEDVVVRGQNTKALALYDYKDDSYPGSSARRMDSTLGEEAARRLNLIAGRPAPFNP